ncbi:Angiotensin-converting enzyme, partial [Operophtera brumata]
MAQWKFVTNITEYNRRRMTEELTLSSKFERLSWRKAAAFDGSRLSDPQGRRQLMKIVQASRAALPDDKFNEICPYGQKPYDPHIPRMPYPTDYQEPSYQQYQLANLPYQHYQPYTEGTDSSNYCDMQLDPEISRILAHSRIESELLYVWRSFRDKTGPKLKNRFMRYVQLANQAAQATGNMWAQNWKSIMDLVMPFPQSPNIDVTSEMLRQGLTPLSRCLPSSGAAPCSPDRRRGACNAPPARGTSAIGSTIGTFITSSFAVPPEFWRGSLLARPAQRSVQCTASAIKQCTEVTMQDLISTHHEMAHIQYYLQYSEQPQLFRDGANPGEYD